MHISIGFGRFLVVLGYIALFLAMRLSLEIDGPLFALTPTFFSARDAVFQVDIIIAGLLVFLLASSLPIKFEKPSDLIVHIQFVFPILPMFVLYTKYDLSAAYFYSVIFAFALVLLIVKIYFPALRFGDKGVAFVSVLRACSLLVILLLIYIVAMGGGTYFNLNFWDVYEYRQAAADNLPPILGYVLSVTTKVLLPVIAVCGIVERKYIYTLFAFLCGLLMFGLMAHKAVLFYPIFAVLLYLGFQKGGVKLVWGIAAFIIAVVLGYETGILPDFLFILFVDRLLFIPAAINFMFADWFSQTNNMFVFWSDSKISLGLLDYPYDLSVPFLIGKEYFNNPLAGANTGWLGAGYANAGIGGVVFYGLAMGLILAVLNGFAHRFGGALVLAVASGALLSPLLSSDLPNAFLTHGLIVVFLLFLFLKDFWRREVYD